MRSEQELASANQKRTEARMSLERLDPDCYFETCFKRKLHWAELGLSPLHTENTNWIFIIFMNRWKKKETKTANIIFSCQDSSGLLFNIQVGTKKNNLKAHTLVIVIILSLPAKKRKEIHYKCKERFRMLNEITSPLVCWVHAANLLYLMISQKCINSRYLLLLTTPVKDLKIETIWNAFYLTSLSTVNIMKQRWDPGK